MRLVFHKTIALIVFLVFLSPTVNHATGCTECGFDTHAAFAATAGCEDYGQTASAGHPGLTAGQELRTSVDDPFRTCPEDSLFKGNIFIKRVQRCPSADLSLPASRSFSSASKATILPSTGRHALKLGPAISPAILAHRTVVLLN